MERDIQQVLLTEEQIQAKIEELGEILTAEYEGKNPVVVGVLKGVVVFYADMIRHIKTPCQLDFMWITSYSGANSTGTMNVRQDLSADIKGRHVLPSFPSQLEWKIGLAWANTRGSLNSPS